MNKSKEVRKDIFWVGALDFDIRVFDIIMRTEYGTSYNSYVIKGTEKTALVEISKVAFWDEFYERLSDACEPAKIDYIIANHTEPDHSGALVKLLDILPDVEVIGSMAAIRFLKAITNKEFKSRVVKDGDILDLGGKTLKFINAPFLHWPDSMYTYSVEDKTLFTCDSFGCHYCSDIVFNDLMDDADFYDAYKYYFDKIMGPFKTNVLQALDKIKDLEIETICTGHGPVLRKDIQKYLNYYREWATVTPPAQKSVVIAYLSVYGFTRKMAEKICEGVKSKGVDCYLYDMMASDESEILEKIEISEGILFGSPTLVGDTLPPMWKLLSELNPIIHKGKVAGAFGSFGWSGEAVPNIEGRLKQLKLAVPAGTLCINFNPSEEQEAECFEYGKTFAEHVLTK